MFYQRDGGGDYRFYSPYTDGPDKLVTGVEAINSRLTALRLIRNSAGPEVMRISLSLLPDEPVTRKLENDIAESAQQFPERLGLEAADLVVPAYDHGQHRHGNEQIDAGGHGRDVRGGVDGVGHHQP